jgi:hypothetical protein
LQFGHSAQSVSFERAAIRTIASLVAVDPALAWLIDGNGIV